MTMMLITPTIRTRMRSDEWDQLLHKAVHDLKNPINTIRLAHYNLRASLEDSPQVNESLESIDTALSSLTELVEDILCTAALEGGSMQLRLEAIPADQVLWEAASRYAEHAARKDMGLIIEADECVVMADPRRLGQILNNLLSHVIRTGAAGSSFLLTARPVGSAIRFSLSGKGLLDAQADASGLFVRGTDRTGLGLWIVRELAELHGGRAEIERQPGSDPVIWVELPAAPARV